MWKKEMSKTENIKSPPGKRKKHLSQSKQGNHSNGVKPPSLGPNLILNNSYISKEKPRSKYIAVSRNMNIPFQTLLVNKEEYKTTSSPRPTNRRKSQPTQFFQQTQVL